MKHSIVDACLDWSCYDSVEGLLFVVDLLFITPYSVTLSDFDAINEKVQILLNKNQLIFNAQTLFQQTHPGEGAASVMAGNTGRDGANQSD